ncbi:hypothetical protein HanIR_Chr04g0185931 [Helianthus annuus]|nr:hypothetical protein HanIR_Chr04g0185931 [Helianthus annuus]
MQNIPILSPFPMLFLLPFDSPTRTKTLSSSLPHHHLRPPPSIFKHTSTTIKHPFIHFEVHLEGLEHNLELASQNPRNPSSHTLV